MLFCIQPLACEEGYFGINCFHVCSPYCKPGTCRHTDGWCTFCTANSTADNCTTGNCFKAHSLFHLLLCWFERCQNQIFLS